MKHIRKYNESERVTYLSLKSYFEDNLPYLVDDNFDFEVFDEDDEYYVKISKDNGDVTFDWQDIKYDFVPFLELFQKKYSVGTSINLNVGFRSKSVFIKEVINPDNDFYFKHIDSLWIYNIGKHTKV